MNLILQAQWVTQASDFLTQNWDKLLGILGGASGIIALLTLIGKIVLVCVQGKIARKNNTPLQTAFNEFKEEVVVMISELKVSIEEYNNNFKEEIKEYLQQLIEKSQRMKMALYDKLVTEGENAQQLYDELNGKIEELQELIESPSSEPVESPKTTELVITDQVIEENVTQVEIKNNEPVKRTKRKNKKVIVER